MKMEVRIIEEKGMNGEDKPDSFKHEEEKTTTVKKKIFLVILGWKELVKKLGFSYFWLDGLREKVRIR